MSTAVLSDDSTSTTGEASSSESTVFTMPQAFVRLGFGIVSAARAEVSSINNLSAVEMKVTPLGVRLVATDGCRLHQVDFFADNRQAFELLAASVCDVPEYSQLSDSLTILIPSHAVDKLAAIYNGPSAVRFAVRGLMVRPFAWSPTPTASGNRGKSLSRRLKGVFPVLNW